MESSFPTVPGLCNLVFCANTKLKADIKKVEAIITNYLQREDVDWNGRNEGLESGHLPVQTTVQHCSSSAPLSMLLSFTSCIDVPPHNSSSLKQQTTALSRDVIARN